MAKDGTRRGGARAGAGRKPKALTDKINEGISATIIELPETPTMEGVDVPPASRVSGMETIREFFIMDSNTCTTVCRNVIISAFHCR